MLWIFLASRWPSLAAVCLARAIALVESECIVMCRYGEAPNHFYSLSYGCYFGIKGRLSDTECPSPLAMAGPVPILSAVIIHLKPADSHTLYKLRGNER
jgi:hypothetical protein